MCKLTRLNFNDFSMLHIFRPLKTLLYHLIQSLWTQASTLDSSNWVKLSGVYFILLYIFFLHYRLLYILLWLVGLSGELNIFNM